MRLDEFERLNFLSQKLINKKATNDELREFNQLFDNWNDTKELNLINLSEDSFG